MPMRAAIVIPTRDRAEYLDVALRTICPQASAHGADVLVIDDGPDNRTRAVAARHGARYVAQDPPRGLNAARNTAIDATEADLIVYVDDDVAVHDGWLAALLRAAAACPPEVGVLTGPILPRIEDHRFPMCGREGPPITFLDLGPEDTDTRFGWGANMAIRREVYEKNPWIAMSLYKAFAESQKRTYEDLYVTAALKTMLPWLTRHVEDARALMGDDFWPYGFEPNRKTLETFLRYHHEQGLSKTLLKPEELFAKETLEAFKI